MDKTKNIIRSAFVIGVMIMLLSTATQSYFSHTEPSNGNSITAATITFGTGGFGTEDVPIKMDDIKPCITGLYDTTLENQGDLDIEIWKHLKDIVTLENGIAEAEQEYYDANGIGSMKGYWRFEEGEDWDGTAEEVTDRSPYENHGTTHNGAIQNDFGKIGQCAEFDGTNEYIQIPNVISGDDTHTVSFWANPAAFGTYGGVWIDLGADSGYSFIQVHSSSLYVGYSPTSTPTYRNYPYSFGVNTWYHVTIVKTGLGDNVEAYVNGVKLTAYSGSVGDMNGGSSMYLGKFHNPGWQSKGLLDEVAIWDEALSEAEIFDMYNDPGILEGSGNDIDQAILYDMWIDNDGNLDECGAGDQWIIKEDEGWYISQNDDRDPAIPPTGSSTFNGVSCSWVYLGVLQAHTSMKIVQSYHMEGQTKNWAQSDTLMFTIEYYIQQDGGPAPVPELPGHGQSDWPPYT